VQEEREMDENKSLGTISYCFLLSLKKFLGIVIFLESKTPLLLFKDD
jgi:hypothetical protein